MSMLHSSARQVQRRLRSWTELCPGAPPPPGRRVAAWTACIAIITLAAQCLALTSGGRWMKSPFGAAVSHSWVDTYENYTAARCARLLRGDPVEQDIAAGITANRPGSFSCYRDAYIGRAPCGELRAAFRRPFYVADSHRDFPLAYGLRVHTCATQVELLLHAIYAPQNFYCIHVDAKASPDFISAMRRIARCVPNVHMLALDEDFVYGSISQLEADLECMQLALQSPVGWRYFINLPGQELPLKTNYELVRFLRSLNGSSHVYVETPANTERQTHSYWCRYPIKSTKMRCLWPRTPKAPVPGNLTVYKSCANAEFSRAFVEYLFEKDGFARRLYDWFSDTDNPEEHYFASLVALPDAPGGVWKRIPTRAVMWEGGQCRGRFFHGICILVSADLPSFVGRPEPFVNKLHFEDDPFAVRCLVETLLARDARQRAWL